jgi:hypothetical protein
MGHVVEVRLQDSVYQFNTTGFVSSGDHFDWPVRTRQILEKVSRKKSFVLAERVLAGSSGADLESSMIAWATLETLAADHPEDLGNLFLELADLHALADPYGLSSVWRPGPEETLAALQQLLARLEVDEVVRHLKSID